MGKWSDQLSESSCLSVDSPPMSASLKVLLRRSLNGGRGLGLVEDGVEGGFDAAGAADVEAGGEEGEDVFLELEDMEDALGGWGVRLADRWDCGRMLRPRETVSPFPRRHIESIFQVERPAKGRTSEDYNPLDVVVFA